jgi:uncharacterized protein
MTEWYIYLAVVGVGVFAGYINTLAGSGSLLTLPLLMFLGLPPNVANGTNRVAILLQNVIGVASFTRQKKLDFKLDIWLAIPAIFGAILGAVIAVDINVMIMKQVIGALLLIMFFVILFKPEVWVKEQAGTIHSKPGPLKVIIFFAIGLYGGFIQAGVGFFLLTGLVMGAGLDLVRANAVKVFIVLCYTPVALFIFYMNDQVDFFWGLILALGNMTGAFLATKMAVRKGSSFVRYVLLLIIFLASVHLLGFTGILLKLTN